MIDANVLEKSVLGHPIHRFNHAMGEPPVGATNRWVNSWVKHWVNQPSRRYGEARQRLREVGGRALVLSRQLDRGVSDAEAAAAQWRVARARGCAPDETSRGDSSGGGAGIGAELYGQTCRGLGCVGEDVGGGGGSGRDEGKKKKKKKAYGSADQFSRTSRPRQSVGGPPSVVGRAERRSVECGDWRRAARRGGAVVGARTVS